MPTAAERAKDATIGEMAVRSHYEVLRAGREKVMRSAPLWRRVTDGKPCGFCAMLASRGPVYRSASEAGQGNKYHGRCGCTVEPYEGDPDDWEPTPDEARFIEAYQSVYRPGMKPEDLADEIELWLSNPANEGNDAASFFARAFDGGEAEVERLGQAYADEMNKVLTARGYSAEVRSAYRVDYPGDQINVMTSIKDAAGDVVGEQFRSFARLADGEGFSARHDFFTLDKAHQSKGLASELGPVMEDWYRSAGVRHIDLTANVDVGGYTWAKKGYDWSPDAERPVGIMERMANAADRESDTVQQLVADLYESLAGPRSGWPSPYELAMAGWEPGATDWLGKRVMLGSEWYGRKVL